MPQRSAKLRTMSESAEHALVVGDLVGRHVTLERMRFDHVSDLVRAGSGDRSTFGFTGVPDGVDQATSYVTALLTDAEGSRCAPFVQRRVADGLIVGCTRYM